MSLLFLLGLLIFTKWVGLFAIYSVFYIGTTFWETVLAVFTFTVYVVACCFMALLMWSQVVSEFTRDDRRRVQ